MIDRNVQYPHRYQLVPVAGQDGVYDIIAKPGTITDVGTPINKATLLSDATAALYGLSGEDATVNNALSTIPPGYQSAVKTYGNVAYTDSIAKGTALTKNIAIGPGKKFGMLVMRRTDGTVSLNFGGGIMVFFSTNNLKTLVIGNDFPPTSSTGNRNAGGALCRRHYGAITNGYDTQFGGYAASEGQIQVQEVYIEGNNLRIDFFNRSTDYPYSLNCTIDWEVW